MRNPFIIILCLLHSLAFSQIPAGYYDSSNGLSGSALKNVLNDIIDGHTEYTYTASTTDVWDILKESDNAINIISSFLFPFRNSILLSYILIKLL